MGADGYFALINQAEHVGELVGLHPYRVRHLLDRYGSLMDEVLALARRTSRAAQPDQGGAGLPEGGGAVRRRRRGGPASRGHPGPPDADLHRILAPRRRLRPRGGRGGRAGAGLERRGHRPRGRPTTPRGSRPRSCRRPSPTTCRRTNCGPAHPRRAPRSSSRCPSIEMGMRPAPLPVRDGLGPARVRLHGGPVLAELTARFGARGSRQSPVPERSSTPTGRWSTPPPCCPAGPVSTSTANCPTRCRCPSTIPVLYRDANIVVVDKPHFLATMPRGRHVAQTALVRLRRELRLPELSPAHRLDRLTAGVLLFTTRREVRGAYQTLFARGLVRKTYLARAPVEPDLALPRSGAQPHHQAARPPAGGVRAGCAQRRDAGGAVGAGRPLSADAAHRTHPPAAGAHGVAGRADHRRSVVPQRH